MFPIHPALVHFPIALLTFAVIADVIGYFWERDGLRKAANWSIIGAFIGALLAAPAGYFDMIRQQLSPGVHGEVHTHMYIGLVLLAGLAGLALWRWTLRGRPLDSTARRAYLVVATIALAATLYQGYLGHDLVVEHGVGVAASAGGTVGEGTASGGHEHGEHMDGQEHHGD